MGDTPAVEILGAGVVAFVLTFGSTSFVRRAARRFRAVRAPGGRHLHKKAVPLWGGVAAAGSILVVLLTHPTLVLSPELLALVLGLFAVLVFGMVDDKRELPWWQLFVLQGSVAVLLLLFGVRLWYVNGPFGQALRLDALQVALPQSLCIAGECMLPVIGSLVVVGWVVAAMNAVNWLDGTDGAAAAVSAVTLFVVALLSLRPDVLQPPLAIVASAGAGAALAFLLWNAPLPQARIFLGSAGSFGFGFLIAALAVLAGAKLATVAMVMLLPAADAAAVIGARFVTGVPLTQADTRHLHHILRRRGWSPRTILLFLVAASVVFGAAALLLDRPWKVWVLSGAFAGVTGVLFWMKIREDEKEELRSKN